MARMYSRKQGNAGSTKPLMKDKQAWVRYKAKEIELLVGKISKEGKSVSQIGTILRDTYGIPSVKQFCEKSISKIIADKGNSPEIPEDLMALIRKSIELRRHMGSNKQDTIAKRGLELTESHIRRMVKYYKRTNKLSAGWKYDPAKIRLMLK